MKKLAICSFIVVVTCVTGANAAGLLGTDYVGFSAGIMEYTDTSVLDTGFNLQGLANFNLTNFLDAQIGGSYMTVDGQLHTGRTYDYTAYTLSGGLVAFMDPIGNMRPFANASVGYVDKDNSMSSVSNDTAFYLGGGMEIEWTEQWLTQIGLNAVKIDDDEFGQADLMLGWWMKENVLLNVRSNIGFAGEEGTDFVAVLMGANIMLK